MTHLPQKPPTDPQHLEAEGVEETKEQAKMEIDAVGAEAEKPMTIEDYIGEYGHAIKNEVDLFSLTSYF